MNKLDSNSVVQIGIIVKDAEATAAHYAEVFGIPKPEVVYIANDSFAKTQYHDQPTSAKAKAVFFKLGPVEMEVIEPIGAPSTWEEFLRTKGEGIHHIAFRTKDMAGARQFLDSNGMSTIQVGGWDGGQYAYIESVQKLGTVLELLQFE